ncbi:hypothetical protein LF1_57160 [Rubripirellula obstinata]|uniref:Uncharacterized protein n=1 Tax=Rubripirellula obstinata TaxID=406547 RepID=A0A5B1CBM2_9BACT|nr:hypothetical protein LF1_57160 [Rubripirellula obstinata]
MIPGGSVTPLGETIRPLQIRLIVNYLKYMQQFGVEPQYQYDWGGRDDEMLSSWMNHLAGGRARFAVD